MENLFSKKEDQDQNNKSEFENFAIKNKLDQLDQNELNMIRGGESEDDLIVDWK